MDVRVFNPHAPSNAKMSALSMYKRHEAEKRRRYEARVRDTEHASFVPIVFSVAGGCGKAAAVLMKRIGSMLCEKKLAFLSSHGQYAMLHLLRIAAFCSGESSGPQSSSSKITSRAVSRVS